MFIHPASRRSFFCHIKLILADVAVGQTVSGKQSRRFRTVSEQEFNRILTEKDAKNTRRATESAVRTFRTYFKAKDLPIDFETLSKPDLDNLLKKL
jgi:hypothetical protein